MRGPATPLVALLACIACASVPSPPSAHPVVFGLTSPVGEQVAQDGANDLTAYLSREVAPGTVARVFDDPKQLAAALENGTIQAAWLTPGAYIQATGGGARVHALVKFSRNSATTYRSVLITKAGGPSTLDAFKGKTLALVAAGSMSGHTYPLALLAKHGIDPQKYFASVVDAKDHKEVCSLVLSGSADLGSTLADVRDGPLVADGCREAGFDPAQFAVVASTGPVPNDVIAVRDDLDAATVDNIRQALVRLATTDAGRKSMHDIFRADGLAPAADRDFDVARQLINSPQSP